MWDWIFFSFGPEFVISGQRFLEVAQNAAASTCVFIFVAMQSLMHLQGRHTIYYIGLVEEARGSVTSVQHFPHLKTIYVNLLPIKSLPMHRSELWNWRDMSHRSAHLARILPPSIILSRGPKGVQGIACNTKNAEIGICEVRMQYPGEELPGQDRKASIEYVSHQQSTKSFSIIHYIIIFWTVLEMLVEPHIT